MTTRTTQNVDIDSRLTCNYFIHLVNSFYKILPMREANEESLPTYIESLQVELLGCSGLICKLEFDPLFLTLLCILQYFIEYPNCPVGVTKREVFKAISICKTLQDRFSEGGEAI